MIKLSNPTESLGGTARPDKYREHKTPIKGLLNQRSHRALGRARDRGIIK